MEIRLKLQYKDLGTLSSALTQFIQNSEELDDGEIVKYCGSRTLEEIARAQILLDTVDSLIIKMNGAEVF